MVINRVISASKVNKRKERCIASSKHSRAETPAFSSHEPLVQQPAGQLFLNHNAVTLFGVKRPHLPDDLKGSLPTIEELEKELGDFQEVEDDE